MKFVNTNKGILSKNHNPFLKKRYTQIGIPLPYHMNIIKNAQMCSEYVNSWQNTPINKLT